MRNIFKDDDYDDEEPSLLDKLRDGPLRLNKQSSYDPIELPEPPKYEPIELLELPKHDPLELPELENKGYESSSKQYDDWKTNEFRLTGKHPDFDKPNYLKQCDYDPATDSTMHYYFEAIEMSKGKVVCKEQEDWKPQELIVKDKPLDKIIETPFDYKPGSDPGMNSFLEAVDKAKELP